MRSLSKLSTRRNKLVVAATALTLGLAALAAAYNYAWYWTGDVYAKPFSGYDVAVRSKTITGSGPLYFEFVTAATANSGYEQGIRLQVVNLNTGSQVYNQVFNAYGGSNAYYNGYVAMGTGTYSVTFYATCKQPSTANTQIILGNTNIYWY
jgi:hypothetical protein